MFNNLLTLSPFVYGISFIFAVFLARIKAFRFLIFPIYIICEYFFIDLLYKGEIWEKNFIFYSYLLADVYLVYAIVRLMFKKDILKILITSIPALVFVVESHLHLSTFILLVSFYITSLVCILLFVLIVLKKIREEGV